MMTEEEAKKKWCPMVRHSSTYAANRWPGTPAEMDDDHVTNCIGSYCMAWRWIITPVAAERTSQYDSGVKAKGYCGLAGKP